MNKLIDTLNSEQVLPVLETEGAVMVVAGAGSGKTRLLTHRIAYLVEEKGVMPYNILAITFTNKAANEMRERLGKMIAEPKQMWICTFHSMCVRILRHFISAIGYEKNFSIYGDSERNKIINKIIDADKDKEGFDKIISWSISDAKNTGKTPDEYLAANKDKEDIERIADVYSQYNKELKENNALDFDDLLLVCYRLLLTDKEAREYYQEKFKYIHVDEFQDTNEIQYKLVKLLADKYKNILIVGDEDQSIYGWRGANIQNIYDFKKDFNCKTFKLERNYRSTKKILNIANKLIVGNVSRQEKTLWTENDEGQDANIFCATSETNEAEYVVYCINSLIAQGYSLSDFAILMRVNALTRAYEEKLMQYNIPYKIFGGMKFYERKEIKDILAYLRVIVNPKDKEAIIRSINWPKRGIGAGAINQIDNYSINNNQEFHTTILNIENTDLPTAIKNKIQPYSTLINELIAVKETESVENIVRYLIKELNLKEVFSNESAENENKKLNIRNFVQSIKTFVEANGNCNLDEYLQYLSLYSDTDDMDEDGGFVNLATVHSAKGLEFKVVFVVGLEEDIFPLKRSVNSVSELEEERRLLYVAITRAEKLLYLTYASKRFLYGNTKFSRPSRFLKELDLVVDRQHVASASEYERRGYFDKHTNPNNKDEPIFIARKLEPEAKKAKIDIDKCEIGVRVRHSTFGEGTIVGMDDSASGVCAEIEFAHKGKVKLVLKYAPLEIV